MENLLTCYLKEKYGGDINISTFKFPPANPKAYTCVWCNEQGDTRGGICWVCSNSGDYAKTLAYPFGIDEDIDPIFLKENELDRRCHICNLHPITCEYLKKH